MSEFISIIPQKLTFSLLQTFTIASVITWQYVTTNQLSYAMNTNETKAINITIMNNTIIIILTNIKPHITTASLASTSRVADQGFDSRLCWGNFSRLSHTCDLKIGTPVATLPDAMWYRVSAETGWSGVNTLWLDGIESLIWNFYLSVAAHTIVWADPSLRNTSMLLGR